jgi:hypothetical protein
MLTPFSTKCSELIRNLIHYVIKINVMQNSVAHLQEEEENPLGDDFDHQF